MVSLIAQNVDLKYKIFNRFTLKAPDPRLNSTGGLIKKSGRNRYVQALEDISFQLHEGDRLGLVGGNGAGKTTLLKALYGVLEPSSGKLLIEGKVDALFDINLGFRPEATGRRNIELRGLINGWSMSEVQTKIDEIIEFSELGEFIDLPLKVYSQGMAARLAFSAATSFKPEILLMDEWIGAGDEGFQHKAGERMHELTTAAGIIILASHNRDLIEQVCNKVLWLEHGRVKAFSSIEEFKNMEIG